jgi:hypothetical protein
VGIGDSWGTREEFLHPRDSHGRFRKSWKMADNVISRISDFLNKFNPQIFGNDGQAGQFAFNLGQKSPTKFAGGEDLHRLRLDFDHSNHALRLGQADPSTDKFVKMMEREKIAAPNDMILSRVMTPEAFGLHADTGDQIQELTGKLVADRGYGAARIGSPLGESVPGQPRVLMTIATPKGTPIIVPGESRDDRRIFLDKQQNLRITKVKPDGKGGYYVLAVAEPGNQTVPEPGRKLSPSGVTPQQREATIAAAVESGRNRTQGNRTAQAASPSAVSNGPNEVPTTPAPAAPTPQTPAAPTPQTPAAPTPSVPAAPTPSPAPTPNAPRTEAPVSHVIGQGPAAPSAPEVPAAPTIPEAPAAPTVDLRAEVKAAGLPSPSAGPRRSQWNSAYMGVVSGKKHPEDAVRELDADIAKNKALLADDVKTGTDSGPLAGDIKAQQQLRDLIAQKYGLERPAPATPKAEAPAPTDISKMTIPQLRAHAKEQGIKIPSSITRKADIQAHLQGGGTSAPSKPGATATRVTTDEAGKVLKVQHVGEKAASIGKPSPHDQAVRDALQSKSVAEIRRIASDSNIEVPSKIRSKQAAIDHVVNTLNEHQGRSGRSSHANVIRIAGERSAAPTDVSKMTIPQLRAHAKEQGIKIPSSITRKADIQAHIQGGGTPIPPKPGATATRVTTDETGKVLKVQHVGEKAAPSDVSKMTISQLRAHAKEQGIKIPSSITRKADIQAHIQGGGKAATPSAPSKPKIDYAAISPAAREKISGRPLSITSLSNDQLRSAYDNAQVGSFRRGELREEMIDRGIPDPQKGDK